MASDLPSAHRREARIALAMLPVGAAVLVASAVGVVAAATLLADVAWRQPPGWGWSAGWSLAAIGVGVRNGRAGIEMMSAFDWRPLPAVLALSAAVVAGWPGWW